ncbi:MAG: dienelactone hydrolase family protein, partial [Nitrososphaeraceae archaeon]
MKNSAVQSVLLLLVIGSLLLPTVAVKQVLSAQSPSSSTTNSTVLSGDDGVQKGQQLQNKTINYIDGSSGYLVYPNTTNNTTSTTGQQQKLPAVVMIHEWWGLNDNIKDMANELAGEGYV